MGRSGGTCGAVTGALMALGLGCCERDPSDAEAREPAYDLAAEFMARFGARHGSLDCHDLLGADLRTADGVERCPSLVRSAAELVGSLLSLDGEAETLAANR